MIRRALRFILATWRSLSFAGSVLALLWFWPDIRDLPEAYGFKWGQVMPDREAVALVLLGISVVWIVWIDVRPRAMRWWRSRKELPLKVEFPDWVNHIGKYGPNKKSTFYLNKDAGSNDRFTRSKYYIGITNTTQRTIKNVSIYLHELKSGAGSFPEKKLTTETGAVEINLRPGQTDYFLIGFRDNPEMNAEHVSLVDGAVFRRIEAEWAYHGPKNKDIIGFMMVIEGQGRIPLIKNDGAGFVLGVYAEDVPPSRHLFVANCKNRFEIFYDGPLAPEENPLTESTMGRVKMRRTPTRYQFEESGRPKPQDMPA